MKVTLVNTYADNGGAAIACRRLSGALTGSTEAVVMQIHQDESGFMSKTKAMIRLGIEKLKFLFHEKSAKDRFKFSLANTGIDITNLSEIRNTDIIHLHWINNGFLSLDSLEKIAALNKPVVWTLHDMWAFTGGCHYSGTCTNYSKGCGNCPFLKNPSPDDLSSRINTRKKEILAKLNLTVVTCSHWLADCARQSSLLKGKSIYTIPNPIDTGIYRPKQKEELRAKYRLPSDKQLILFAAANIEDERKGFSYLLQALGHLKKNNPEFDDQIELVVLGKFKQEVKPVLPYTAHFPGYIAGEEMMSDYYALADVFVTPSIEDNLPNTIMESMSSGTPVVAFHTGGIPDMIMHMQNGYLARYKSYESMAEGITFLMRDKYAKNSFAIKARKKVEDTFRQDRVAKQYYQIYEKVVMSIES